MFSSSDHSKSHRISAGLGARETDHQTTPSSIALSDTKIPLNVAERPYHATIVRRNGPPAGLGDNKIVTGLCPGGKDRMRRMLSVVTSGRVDLSATVTHQYSLDKTVDAYELFANQEDGVLKVAIKP